MWIGLKKHKEKEKTKNYVNKNRTKKCNLYLAHNNSPEKDRLKYRKTKTCVYFEKIKIQKIVS